VRAWELHAPGIACLMWAVAWSAGVHGDAVVVVGLTVVGCSYINAHLKRSRSKPERERSLWWLRLMLPVWAERLWLVALSGLVLWSVWAQAQQNDRTTGSLCELRHDLERRVASSEEFLRDHPRGIPGIPAATLKVGVDGQRRTIRALSNLPCG
jgi:hypothetical protein